MNKPSIVSIRTRAAESLVRLAERLSPREEVTNRITEDFLDGPEFAARVKSAVTEAVDAALKDGVSTGDDCPASGTAISGPATMGSRWR